jgi:hypothetical protein
MAKQTDPAMPDMMLAALKALAFELPVAGMKRGIGKAENAAVAESAWKGYDASIRLVSASIDRLYRSRRLATLLAGPVEGLLRWQRLNNALTGAFFAALWRAVDLPTATEVNALREELGSLAASVKAQSETIEALALPPRPQRVPRKARGERTIGAAA